MDNEKQKQKHACTKCAKEVVSGKFELNLKKLVFQIPRRTKVTSNPWLCNCKRTLLIASILSEKIEYFIWQRVLTMHPNFICVIVIHMHIHNLHVYNRNNNNNRCQLLFSG